MCHAPAVWMIGTQELMIVLAILLLIFGGARLPQLAKGLGKSIHEFKRGAAGIDAAAGLGRGPDRQLD